MRIGILTGGGDCPGLNAVIRAVARRAFDAGDEVVGVLHGWRGLIEGQFRTLGPIDVSGILPRGGTILKTSRTNPYKVDGGVERVLANMQQLDALVAIGGEDTLGVARLLPAWGYVCVPRPSTTTSRAPTPSLTRRSRRDRGDDRATARRR
jgi:6-phosphofructokinase 1